MWPADYESCGSVKWVLEIPTHPQGVLILFLVLPSTYREGAAVMCDATALTSKRGYGRFIFFKSWYEPALTHLRWAPWYCLEVHLICSGPSHQWGRYQHHACLPWAFWSLCHYLPELFCLQAWCTHILEHAFIDKKKLQMCGLVHCTSPLTAMHMFPHSGNIPCALIQDIIKTASCLCVWVKIAASYSTLEWSLM